VPSDRTGGNGQKLKHKKLHLNIRSSLFTVRGVKHWKKFSRKTVEPSSLEILITCLDTIMSNLLQLTLF